MKMKINENNDEWKKWNENNGKIMKNDDNNNNDEWRKKMMMKWRKW